MPSDIDLGRQIHTVTSTFVKLYLMKTIYKILEAMIKEYQQ
jgi:hypothetical protein